MPHDLSYEDPEATFFITTRTISSKLWFVNNRKLEWYVLAFLARYQEMYGVILYGFVLMGNHYHLIARFPRSNKAAFLRSFNGIVARLVSTHVPGYSGGKLWARRARTQILAEPADIEHWMLYAALNPVSSGLVRRFSEYPGYNSFSDSVNGRNRLFKLLDRSDFLNRRRGNSRLKKEHCVRTHMLSFHQLPGYDHLSRKEYAAALLKKAAERSEQIGQERRAAGKGFAGRDKILAMKAGATPRETKRSDRHSFRPLVLSLSSEARRIFLDRYFRLLEAFKFASNLFRAGDLTVVFPPGTYRPSLFCPI